MPPHTRRNPPRNSGLTATRNGAVSAKDAIGPMRACVFTAKIRVLGTQILPSLGAAHLDTSCGTASSKGVGPWRAGATTGVVGWDGDMPH